MTFPCWDDTTKDLVLDTAIDPLPELRKAAQEFLKNVDVRPRDQEKFHGRGWVDGEWVEF